jgi:hypothetical protein
MQQAEALGACRWQLSYKKAINKHFFSVLEDNTTVTRVLLIRDVINCVSWYSLLRQNVQRRLQELPYENSLNENGCKNKISLPLSTP